MMTKHHCLDGTERLGDELDCPKCRAQLLKAFSAPAGVPEVRPEPDMPSDPNRCPFCRELRADMRVHVYAAHPERYADWSGHPSARSHLEVPEHFSRSVQMRPPTEPEAGPEDPLPDPFHITEHGVDPDPDQPGGEWFVRCSCGWHEVGHYARDGMGQKSALRLAGIKAVNHRRDAAKEADSDDGT